MEAPTLRFSTGGSLPLLALLVCLFALVPIASGARQCSIYNPGLPAPGGIPRCPCGQAYVTINCVGSVPTKCSICSASWTSNGCYPTSNAIFSSTSGNPRCRCKSGACCRTGSASGMFSPSGTVCRSGASGTCQADAKCTGSSASCPANPARPKGQVCRAAAGECDVAETCSGSSTSCPTNAFRSSSTACGAAATNPGCDVRAKCTGKSATCPSKGFKAKGTVCQAASGGCQNPAVCTGSSYTCPARTTKVNGTVCAASSGFCQNDALCDGASIICPTRTFKPNTTVCQATDETCFTSAVCTGTKASCDPLTIKPEGTICGNNSLCSKPLNNTCDSFGECIVSECPVCPNGFQGADCSCRAGPPTYNASLSLNATCFNGSWYVQKGVEDSLNIQPGSSVVIEGSVIIPENRKLKLGSGSILNITECLYVYGTIEGLYSKKFKNSATVNYDESCSLVSNITLALPTQQQSYDKCTAASSKSQVTTPGLLSVLFQATSTCSFNYPAYVIAPIAAAAGAAGIGVASYLIYQNQKYKNPLPKLGE